MSHDFPTNEESLAAKLLAETIKEQAPRKESGSAALPYSGKNRAERRGHRVRRPMRTTEDYLGVKRHPVCKDCMLRSRIAGSSRCAECGKK